MVENREGATYFPKKKKNTCPLIIDIMKKPTLNQRVLAERLNYSYRLRFKDNGNCANSLEDKLYSRSLEFRNPPLSNIRSAVLLLEADREK